MAHDLLFRPPGNLNYSLDEIADGVARLAREKLGQAPFRLPALNPMGAAPKRLGFEAVLWLRGRGPVEARWNTREEMWVCDALQDDPECTAYIRDDDCRGWWPVPEVREG